jgi:hypothetical protein
VKPSHSPSNAKGVITTEDTEDTEERQFLNFSVCSVFSVVSFSWANND